MNVKLTLGRPLLACEYDVLVALWISRLALHSEKALRQIARGPYSEEIRQLLGFKPIEGRFSHLNARCVLKTRLEQLQKRVLKRNGVLFRNIAMLAELMPMDEVQQHILTFAALATHHVLLKEMIEGIRLGKIDEISNLLSTALGFSNSRIKLALGKDSPLTTSGILRIERDCPYAEIQLCLMPGFLDSLLEPHKNLDSLMGQFIERAPAPTLKEEDFPHYKEEIHLLSRYLGEVTRKGIAGINILIYGPPGTGKTEFSRFLVKHLRNPLYVVKSADKDGSSMSAHGRLVSYQLSQRFLDKSGSLVLFDEIEDIFTDGDDFFSSMRTLKNGLNKAWINQLLENNPVPTIWISNEIDQIDKSYLRRFDYSIEMAVPPASVRKGILGKYLKNIRISPDALNLLAQHEHLSPAQIQKAAKVLTLSNVAAHEQEKTLCHLIERSMMLLDQKPNTHTLDATGNRYSLDYLNTNYDICKLVERLKSTRSAKGNICLYGAPGTGKTALAHHIAQALDRPLLVRRASDILDLYVGVTEQNIASMFVQAGQDHAVLLLDEADSFLSERTGARASWEVTQVNEMLTRMETFQGLFICSTNLMARLDAASLRRFTLKIRFDYLKPEQSWSLFLAHIGKIAKARSAHCEAMLRQLNNLTPGDFATVRRQIDLFGDKLSPEEFLLRLRQECQAKPDQGGRAIGFVH
jgi:transitional endoplasmic reticulum ATPase